MRHFFQNTVVKIITFVAILLFIASVFMFKNFYIKQYNKCWGMWHIYKGDKAYAKGELKNALKYYHKGLIEYPEHSQARCNLANMYVSFEDYTSAVEQYIWALQYHPNYMVCRMDLGIIQAEKLAEFDKAIQEYQKVADTERQLIWIPFVYDNSESTTTNRGYAYYNMGLAYKSKSMFTPREDLIRNPYLAKAAEAYKKALKINKKDYDTMYNLALTEHLLGNSKEAGLKYCEAIETKPLNYEAHFNLAILLDSLGYYDEAIEEFDKAGSLMNSGDYEKSIYLNDLLNTTHKKKSIEAQKTIEKGIVILGDEHKKNPDSKKVEFEETKVIIENGKYVIKEESAKVFLRKMKTCESKKIFKEM